MASIMCGKCRRTHHSVPAVRACHDGKTFTCGWLYYGPLMDDGERPVLACDALAWDTARGYECDNGHEHVNAEARRREGWDYAEDEYEAGALMAYGVQAVGMDGGSITPDLATFRQVLAGA
jgi:hypothetical protein